MSTDDRTSASARPACRALVLGALSVAAVACLVLVAPSGTARSTAGSVRSLEPLRLVDTRDVPDATTFDGRFRGDGALAAGATYAFDVAGRGSVSNDAAAAMLNVTAVAPDGFGFLTVFPCGSKRPNASNVNYGPGDVAPNAVLAKIGDGGRVCVFTLAATDLIVDVNGYVPAGGTPIPVAPQRLVETRAGADAKTGDGSFEGDGRIGAGETYAFTVAGRGGVVDGAVAAMLNVTAVDPAGFGFLTVFACGSKRPNASNVNYGPGDVAPNAVLAKIGDGGQVCVYSLADTDLVVDVNGYVPADGAPTPVAPGRLVETRSGPGAETVDGEELGFGRLTAGQVYAFEVVGRGGVAEDAAAVMLNVTAVNPSAFGFLTVYPCGVALPNASNVNYGPEDVAPNAVLVKVGLQGRVCVFTLAETDLIVDVNGFVAGVPPVDDTVTPPETTEPPPSPPQPGGTFVQTTTVQGAEIRWNPCEPQISFVVDPTRSTPKLMGEFYTAVAAVEQATGFDFVNVGSYIADYGSDGFPSVPFNADVGVTFSDNGVSPQFDLGVIGFAGPAALPSTGEIIFGTITIDATPGPEFDRTLIWKHELAHLMGLDHVPDGTPGELMQPFYDPVVTDYGPGDLEGLWNVGLAQPCFPDAFSAPGEVERIHRVLADR